MKESALKGSELIKSQDVTSMLVLMINDMVRQYLDMFELRPYSVGDEEIQLMISIYLKARPDYAVMLDLITGKDEHKMQQLLTVI